MLSNRQARRRAPDASRYYVEQVARGQEDYYAGEGEAPGAWSGSGAAALGLVGEVDEGGLTRLLRAADPATGEPLRRSLASGAVAGFDLTFGAPKSVSVLWAVGEAGVARQVRLGHEARWYQRGRREEIDGALAGHVRAQSHWRERVDELKQQFAAGPEPPDPPDLWRAADPLSASDVGLEPDLAVPALDLAPDVGLDLGP